ncbi:MAG: class I SAM-dependent methyltransferase [Bacteroidota bacterium]|nr:class I SAM-dependent methyltransferase [Bacteroidota bacterium]
MSRKVPTSTAGSKKAATMIYPEYFARFYDLIYHRVRDGVDNTFYLDRVRKTTGKVLEVGVGTGRLFVEALTNGADIYGIDISPAMIGIVTGKLDSNQKKRISRQNIIDFILPHKFSLILAPFRVFMHLTTKKEQLNALNNVYDHLSPGGEFIFDAFIPDLNLLLNGTSNVTDFDEEFEPGNRVKRTVTSRPDLLNQVLNITFTMEWNEGGKIFRKDWNTIMRYFFRFELEHLVERSEFRKYKILGDFEGNELDQSSREFIVVCKK